MNEKENLIEQLLLLEMLEDELKELDSNEEKDEGGDQGNG